ncbi:Regulator of RNase E activity RraA [Paracoccus alcaliphilus]|uniref:Putative 4-hydroxy-4-methyl-2-oxoglutarate aldolase n=1 Tax=Paracoccus alcaliphilus TaxID=34002 RepID=A0A1H8MM89_9RHOB|nr:RraA family protein [Paracoccus alcaliphilus]WCR21104.1 RraA family protein [Paracoccus alcaliphilus]SEO18358.1 Regulator of RNase E activity RraA [Paracoccus alcaliphilus]
MTPTLLTLLHRVDTPTVCNAIEVVQGKRGFDAFTRGTVLSSAPDSGAIVGYARTAKLSAIAPSSEPVEVVRERRMAYYRYMAEAPNPSIAVIEDLDYPACIGAYWGEINTTVHKGFGIAGALTNGVMRDLGDLPDRFPVIAGSVGPSHGFVHLRDIDCPVTVFGMSVHPGDLIHADRHGAVVIPADVVPQLEAGIAKLMKTERIVLDAARRPDFDFDKFSEAWAEFECQRT